ncbi:anti-sigma regulatory factor (Ser/Thr protein kinase) [Streptomyces olivoverticillatus]|uniref:Anti-sigma regulatory factor (Ser/Thr protein kinase) n=1 Tax=Streptomyces olivoverticillatus TaxID=66427 RepID=A0A7W7PMZ9_9ACTN|nr:ATP-binding protein [Streptomyces olivoverticillatus]MBB4895909.1 anti-sigma regulatory factor (Ser/Thr protein kinase) [Streptomyces olivoverticillatus]
MSHIAHSCGVVPSQDAPSLGHRGGFLAVRLQDAFHFPALNTSVAEARRRVLARLREWGIDEVACDDAQLVVSELFTNAVRHTDSDKVSCQLRINGARLRIEVADQGHTPTEPRARCSGADEESGRGLLLVGALSQAWGVRPDDSGRGRVVWADLPHGPLPH